MLSALKHKLADPLVAAIRRRIREAEVWVGGGFPSLYRGGGGGGGVGGGGYMEEQSGPSPRE